MNNVHTAYNSDTGVILMQIMGTKETVELNTPKNAKVIEGIYQADAYYVDIITGAPIPLKTMDQVPDNLTISVRSHQKALITGIPKGATINWPDGSIEICNTGIDYLTSNQIAEYKVLITCDHYKDKEVLIHAV